MENLLAECSTLSGLSRYAVSGHSGVFFEPHHESGQNLVMRSRGLIREVMIICGEDASSKYSAASTYVSRLEGALRSWGLGVKRVDLRGQEGVLKKLGVPPRDFLRQSLSQTVDGPIFFYSQKLAHLLVAARVVPAWCSACSLGRRVSRREVAASASTY